MTRQGRDPDVPVLFLDFDGVLHPDEVYRVGDKIVLRMDGFCLFEWASLLEDILAPYPSLRIVLSTSWARVLGVGEARSWLAEGLRRRVISATWHAHCPRGWELFPRYAQILGDVKRHAHRRWLAIDDSGEGWPSEHRDRLVLCDPLLGLGAVAVQNELRSKLAWLFSENVGATPAFGYAHTAPPEPQQSDVDEVSAWTALLRQGEEIRLQWVTDGVLMTPAMLAEAWGSTQQAIDDARRRGDVFSIEVGEHRYYPAVFARLPAEAVKYVCQALQGDDVVAKFVFWNKAHGVLGGLTLVEALSSGRHDQVRCVAEAWSAERGVMSKAGSSS
nr:HAD domain-containing protein [Zoogloea sp. LCSB751]